MRTAMGLGEPGYALLVRGETVDTMLQRQEALRPTLRQAIADESLRGYDMAALVLPSTALQRTRRDELPDDETLRARIDEARQGLPFSVDAFRAVRGRRGGHARTRGAGRLRIRRHTAWRPTGQPDQA